DHLAIDVVEQHQADRHGEGEPGRAATVEIGVVIGAARARRLQVHGVSSGLLRYGTRTVAPLVARDSSARCAAAASSSPNTCLGSLTIFPASTRSNNSRAISSICARGRM